MGLKQPLAEGRWDAQVYPEASKREAVESGGGHIWFTCSIWGPQMGGTELCSVINSSYIPGERIWDLRGGGPDEPALAS